MAGHVLQVVTDTDRRGAQVFATDLHVALDRRGVRVRTVALAEGDVGGLELPVLGPTRTHPATMRALWREARDATVVVAHGSTTLPMCAVACPLARTPFVYRQISDSMFWAPSSSRRMRVAIGMRAARRVVALWQGSAATLTSSFHVAPDKIDIVPNGVPVEHFPPIDPAEKTAARQTLGLDPTRPTVLSIGALVPEKGVDLAIEAVSRIAGAQLVIAGDGPQRPALQSRRDHLGATGVHFVGSLTEPRLAYAAADVVVLASRGGDSMPAVLIEAGLLGLPSVATPVEGIVDIVVDGRTGALVPIDDVDALERAIAHLLSDTTDARRRGEAARAHCVDRFSIDVVAEEWETVLRAASRR